MRTEREKDRRHNLDAAAAIAMEDEKYFEEDAKREDRRECERRAPHPFETLHIAILRHVPKALCLPTAGEKIEATTKPIGNLFPWRALLSILFYVFLISIP